MSENRNPKSELREPTSDIRTPKSEFRVLDDCRKLFFMILSITKNNSQYEYNLNNQILRATISIGSNLAEGNNKKDKEYGRYLNIAKGSLLEVEFQLSLYKLDDKFKLEVLDLLDKIKAVIYKLQNRSSDFGTRSSF